ncbi:MAG: TVP38/TMEM64 family protein [Rhizobiales bacterium]|nr:TVP38/TMEM64 family protein [Hyphomicrobiales bacterium]
MKINIRKFIPLGIFIIIFGGIWATGIHNYFSFQAIAENQLQLENYVLNNLVYSVLIFMLIYIVSVSFSLPGASILSLLGGLLFGGFFGGLIIIVSATLGAIGVFSIAKTSIGNLLRKKAGKWMEKIAKEFNDGAASYLLFLRLVPIFPFFVVNLAPALLGARFWTYAWTTFVGIMPATFAYSFVGAGIGSILSNENEVYQNCILKNDSNNICEFNVSVGSLFSQELISGLVALGAVALIPIILKKLKKKSTADQA